MAKYSVTIIETCIYLFEIEAPEGNLKAAGVDARKQFLDMSCVEQLIHLQRIEERSFDVLADTSSQAFDDSELAEEG